MTADEVFAFFLKRLSTYDEPIKYEKIILKDQTDKRIKNMRRNKYDNYD